MKLKDYFERTTGTGILSTADSSGKVNAAIYSRPHFIDGDKLSFILRGNAFILYGHEHSFFLNST
jgi:hypothetical protein